MKKHHRLLSLLLSAALCFGMALPMLADDTAAELPVTSTAPAAITAEDPLSVIPAEEYSKIVFDNDEKYNLMTMNSLLPVVEYTTYKDVACSQVKYSNMKDDAGRDSWRWLSSSGERVQYALTPYMKAADTINTNHKYLVVTYAAKTEGAHTLYYQSFSGGVYTLDKDMSLSKGEWVTTAPVEITTDVYARINGRNYFVLWANIDEEDAELYIREMVFFQDKEDAELYAKDAPLFYDPITEEELKAEEIAKQNRKRILLMMLLLGRESVLNQPAPYIPAPTPFDGIEHNYKTFALTDPESGFAIDHLYINQTNFDPNNYTRKTVHNGIPAYEVIKAATGCSWVLNSATADADSDGIVDGNTYRKGMVAYRHMAFTTSGQIGDDIKWMTITYASTSSPEDASNDMYIWACNVDENGNAGFKAAENIGTNGEWNTITVEIPDNLRSRINAGYNKIALVTTDVSEYEHLYISDISFFSRKYEADMYAENIAEQYNALAPVDYECPIDPYDNITPGAYYEIVYANDSTMGNATIVGKDPAYPVVTYRGVKARQVNAHEGEIKAGIIPNWCTNTAGQFTFFNYPFAAPKNAISNDMKWMVLVFAADPVDPETIYMLPHNGTPNAYELKCGSTSGAWTATVPYELGDQFFNRVNNLNGVAWGKLTLALPDRPEDAHAVKEFYIERMVCFKSKDEAETFAASYTKFLADMDNTNAPYEVYVGDAPFDGIDSEDFSAVRFITDGSGNRDRLNYHRVLYPNQPAPVLTQYGGVDCIQLPYATTPVGWNLIGADVVSGNAKQPGEEGYDDYIAYNQNIRPRYTLTFTARDNPMIDVPAKHTYMAITYASSSSPESNNDLYAIYPAGMKVADDIGTNGAWNTIVYEADGEPAQVPAALISRISGDIATFFITDLSPEEKFYVREIVFFANAEDAEEYAAAAPAHYNSIAGTNAPATAVEPFEKVVGTTYVTNGEAKGTNWVAGDWNGVVQDYPVMYSNGYSYIKVPYCSTKVDKGYHWFMYGMRNCPIAYTSTDARAVITWATAEDVESTSDMGIFHWGGGANSVTSNSSATLAPVATGGEWKSVMLDSINTQALIKRGTQGKVYFYAGCEFYIKEIIVFATEEDANDYLAAAPTFYNTYAPLVTE